MQAVEYSARGGNRTREIEGSYECECEYDSTEQLEFEYSASSFRDIPRGREPESICVPLSRGQMTMMMAKAEWR